MLAALNRAVFRSLVEIDPDCSINLIDQASLLFDFFGRDLSILDPAVLKL